MLITYVPAACWNSTRVQRPERENRRRLASCWLRSRWARNVPYYLTLALLIQSTTVGSCTEYYIVQTALYRTVLYQTVPFCTVPCRTVPKKLVWSCHRGKKKKQKLSLANSKQPVLIIVITSPLHSFQPNILPSSQPTTQHQTWRSPMFSLPPSWLEPGAFVLVRVRVFVCPMSVWVLLCNSSLLRYLFRRRLSSSRDSLPLSPHPSSLSLSCYCCSASWPWKQDVTGRHMACTMYCRGKIRTDNTCLQYSNWVVRTCMHFLPYISIDGSTASTMWKQYINTISSRALVFILLY